MLEDAGTRRGAQVQAAEAGGRRVQATSRWAVLCTGRGGGERVNFRGLQRGTAMYGYEV